MNGYSWPGRREWGWSCAQTLADFSPYAPACWTLRISAIAHGRDIGLHRPYLVGRWVCDPSDVREWLVSLRDVEEVPE